MPILRGEPRKEGIAGEEKGGKRKNRRIIPTTISRAFLDQRRVLPKRPEKHRPAVHVLMDARLLAPDSSVPWSKAKDAGVGKQIRRPMPRCDRERWSTNGRASLLCPRPKTRANGLDTRMINARCNAKEYFKLPFQDGRGGLDELLSKTVRPLSIKPIGWSTVGSVRNRVQGRMILAEHFIPILHVEADSISSFSSVNTESLKISGKGESGAVGLERSPLGLCDPVAGLQITASSKVSDSVPDAHRDGVCMLPSLHTKLH